MVSNLLLRITSKKCAPTIATALFLLVQLSTLNAAEDVRNGKIKVDIVGVTDTAALDNVMRASGIYQASLKSTKKSKTPNYEWKSLLNRTPLEISEALKPYGYYESNVDVTEGIENRVTINVDLGMPVTVDLIELEIIGQAYAESAIQNWLKTFPLKKGDRLVQPNYDAAKSDLIKRLNRLGYLDAEFKQQSIRLSKEKRRAQVSITLDGGQRYRIGDIRFKWLNSETAPAYSERFLASYFPLNIGQEYDSQRLQKLRVKAAQSGYFSAVSVRPLIDSAIDDLLVPIEIELDSPKKYTYSTSIGYGTDTGPRTGFRAENRRVNRVGHKASVSASISEIRQSINASYVMPSLGDIRNGLRLQSSFKAENSDSRDSETTLLGFNYDKSLSDSSQVSVGMSYRNEQFLVDGTQTTTDLLVPSVNWQTVSANDLTSPNKGYRLAISLLGASDSVGSDISFLQANLNSKAVYQFGKQRLLARAQIGRTIIDDEDTLPESLSYFAGGDHSVRGYDFESIGVKTADGDIRGAENLVAMSLEVERPISGAISAAAFVDWGDAFDSDIDIKVGAGIGVRWRLPFGAIRLDVAQALDLEDKPFRLHFTFGTDL